MNTARQGISWRDLISDMLISSHMREVIVYIFAPLVMLLLASKADVPATTGAHPTCWKKRPQATVWQAQSELIHHKQRNLLPHVSLRSGSTTRLIKEIYFSWSASEWSLATMYCAIWCWKCLSAINVTRVYKRLTWSLTKVTESCASFLFKTTGRGEVVVVDDIGMKQWKCCLEVP